MFQGIWTQLATDADAWWRRARGQLHAADAMWRESERVTEGAFAKLRAWTPPERREHYETVNGLFLAVAYHCGIALELAAKGTYARVKRTRPPMNTHDLPDLCELAGLELKSSERALAARLTAAVEWWARYAVPRTSRKFAEAHLDNLMDFALPRDCKATKRLIQRLAEVDAQHRAGEPQTVARTFRFRNSRK